MAVKYRNDVTDYVMPFGEPARLVVTLASSNRDVYDVTAEVDGEPPLTGQFTFNPEWQVQSQRPSSAKSYQADPAQDVGAQLFSALFSGSLSRAWAQARDRARAKGGLHIVIHTASPEVQRLPWELLSDTTLTSSEHVAISEGWSVVRDIQERGASGRPGRDTLTPRAQIAVTVLTTPVPGIDQESDIRILTEAFGHDAVTARRDVDARTVLAEVASSNTNLVHIMGTGRQGRVAQDLALDYRNPDQIVVVSARELMGAAAKADQLELLVLAACETDQLAAQLAEVVPAVIGIRGTISNDGCEVFLAGLYRALASGSTVIQAVAAGRAQQVSFSSSLGDEWAQPVLYLSVDAPMLLAAPVEPPSPEPVVLPGSASDDEQVTQLTVQMKRANLRALRTQWGSVETSNIPAIVASQMEALTRELEGLTGDAP
jgi:hypothetical protein